MSDAPINRSMPLLAAGQDQIDLSSGRVYVRGTKSETSDRWLNLPDWLFAPLSRQIRLPRFRTTGAIEGLDRVGRHAVRIQPPRLDGPDDAAGLPAKRDQLAHPTAFGIVPG